MEKIRVIIDNRREGVKIPAGLRMLTRRYYNAVLRLKEFPCPTETSMTFVNSGQIRELNHQYREKDIPTDVLSFPMGENGQYDEDYDAGAKILGDIVLSMEKTVEQAGRYGHSLEHEVGYLCAHSILHLPGYDHEQDGMDHMHMREKEGQVMTQLGLSSTSSYVLDEDEE